MAETGTIRKTVLIIVGVVAAVVLVALAVFSCFRWLAVNDAADIQGTWYINGTDTPITITEDEIQLTPDVSYRYTLNPTDKTIDFVFTTLEGEGRYRFSLDRNSLAIVDGSFSGIETYFNDMEWTTYALLESLFGRQAPLFVDQKLTLLTRQPAGDSGQSAE